MLINDETIAGIKSGQISVLFRRWKRPGAKTGGTQMTQGGVIGIDTAEQVDADDITELDAREAGFASKADLLAHLNYRDDPIYRLRVYFAGEDPRKALRENGDLTGDEMAELMTKLHKLDRTSKTGGWTREFLQLINDHPAVYSGVLAKKVGMDIPKFKPMVRKLKALSLTESLEVGYRLSPRGVKILSAINQE